MLPHTILPASQIDLSVFAQPHYSNVSPYQSGSADRWYGSCYSPKFTYNGHTYRDEEMTSEQRRQYDAGWDGEDGRKDWGTHETCDGED